VLLIIDPDCISPINFHASVTLVNLERCIKILLYRVASFIFNLSVSTYAVLSPGKNRRQFLHCRQDVNMLLKLITLVEPLHITHMLVNYDGVT